MSGVRGRVLAALVGRAAPTKSVAGKGGAGKKAAKAEAKPSGPSVPVEVRESTVVGLNIFKEGTDLPVRPDAEYPDWLWTLLDNEPPLSELKRRRIEDMSMEELERLVKLDNREKIRGLNSQRAKT